MKEHTTAKRKHLIASLVVLAFVSVVLLLFIQGLLTLNLKFGEALATFAFWLALGAIMGSNKKAEAPISAYLGERWATFVVAFGMFLMFGVLYVEFGRDGVGLSDPREIFGLIALIVCSLALGFIFGADQD